MTLSKQPYKGARDFYPEDKRQQNYIFKVWRETVESFGYEEYDAPMLEPIELYMAKTSEEIVSEQTYVFEDRGGRKVTIRPEMTPTVSRMVAAKRQELPYPLRWYSIPNLWRYERPQKGRLREHWQLNVDIFGIEGIEADLEIIMLADAVMQRFGAQRESYHIRLNSRQLIDYLLKTHFALDDEKSLAIIRLIDKKDKLNQTDFYSAIKEIAGEKADDIEKILSVKEIQCLPEEIRRLPAAAKLHEVEMLLARRGITNATFDISLMRGFDYYTDIVFEIYDTNPENSRSLFGGGRYDGLVGLFGVNPVPTVGFGMGDVTIREFLILHNLLPRIKSSVQLGVILVGDIFEQSLDIISQLRDKGINVAVDMTKRKIDNRLKAAVKAGYPYIVFIGENELSSNEYNLKELATGQEERLSLEELVKKLSAASN